MNRFKKFLIYSGIFLVVVAAGITASVHYLNSSKRTVPIVYANSAMLYELWNTYKGDSIDPGSGRTIDHTTTNSITTSEGESYTMLRSVWMDDHTTFDNSWNFTQANLQRPDYLFSWKYGKLPNGDYGIETTDGGNNTASDGDTEIALALLMAYSRWDEPKYLTAAKQIIPNIWNQEVVLVDGKPVLTADDLERNATTNVVVDPSYFDPAAFKLFAKVDITHNWTGLVNNSYSLLSSLSTSDLGQTSSDNLPPDWITMNRMSGALIPNASASLDTNFSYDAIRIPFRLALDYSWFKDPRDKQVLSEFSYLDQVWAKNSRIEATYGHDGSVVANYESPATYGAIIGYFDVVNPTVGKQIYAAKLLTLYSPDKQAWKNNLDYYDDNWAWFGIALSQGALPNLTVHT